MRKVIAALLCACFLSTGAFAFTFEELDNNEVFAPEIIQKETVSDWAQDDVGAAYAAGLIPALTGNPGFQDTITREQFAELVAHVANIIYGGDLFDMAEVEMVQFSDCDNEAVRQAASIGVVTGVGDGKFAPTQTTNREQIATMIARAIAYLNDKANKNVAPNAGNIEKFTDKGQVSAWAVDGVGVLAANGIMAGTSTTTLSPKDSCTVEQSILLLYRVYQLFMA